MLTALMHPSHAPLRPLSSSPSLFPSPEVEVARCATHVGAPEAEELREPAPEALAGPMADVGLAEPPSADALGVGGPPFSVSEEARDPCSWGRDSRPPRLSPSGFARIHRAYEGWFDTQLSCVGEADHVRGMYGKRALHDFS